MTKLLIINVLYFITTKEKMDIVKKNIKTCCKKWKMTQVEMSEMMGLSEHAVQNFIHGRRQLPDSFLVSLAAMCLVSVRDLETKELTTDMIPDRVTMKVVESKPLPCDEIIALKNELIASYRETIEYQKALIDFLKQSMEKK